MVSPTLTVLANEPDFRLLTCRNAIVTVWLAPPTLQRFQRVMLAGEVHKTRFPEGVFAVNIAGGRGVPDLDAKLLKWTGDNTKSETFNRRLLAVAHVVCVDGLLGTTIRTFISAVQLFTRGAAANRVFDTPEPAKTWLLPLLTKSSERWTRRDLDELFDAVWPQAQERSA